ncbi:putative Holliday junction resolvase [Mycoplasmoides gallisepticum CA06_2006.052-5-2P]|uniref:Putative pre-16S rRNA nuclease n=1 Tax=Mycoplasmoides gallisepticum WI01_2001.043-13-2P TaxID=1159201 RepID=J3T8Z8_MYCGL|nr:Holliday junction resolvase RuvX [Mycoplasmoides gallisepticum]AFP75757.1 putative Holliday junction resolvase [Mycoplasmoides gallisepticum VA94_7994-1-7P]AFP76524.1 putative Holliday junction resolvase [Mycoplasmoides gallisepticum NC95_13295-2-2P]AFP77278.1 putative Holliday junction resolvase [Mycoplasmoides gallisepticum NC96_1596-4-2P]AFP78049.1 putative Holliday junction resolvase [Mycoplasmoides gallisepticum NY01_2001.047-5-1P]AFP78809.1 putative Holliday junction resolvase [Mycopl
MYYVALDVGSKTLGIATGDGEFKIASPYCVISFNQYDFKQCLAELKEKTASFFYDFKFVIGMPKNIDQTKSSTTEMVENFIELLKANYKNEVIIYDESYTSIIANQLLIDNQIKAKKRKEKIDKLAAFVILQSFFDDDRYPK